LCRDSFAAVSSGVEQLKQEKRQLRQQIAEQRRELSAQRDELAQQRHENSELAKKVEILSEELAWARQKLFGHGSEKLGEADLKQGRLFDEAEVESEKPDSEPAVEIAAHERRRPVRKPLPSALPRVEVVLDIPQADKHCGCGQDLVRIGEEVSEKLDVMPPQLRVIRTIRPKYACHACEGSADESHPAVRIAPAAPAIIEGGIATPGLLATIVTAKFCDAVPLYRQEKQFARFGVELSRKSMADWMIGAATACAPLMAILERQLRAGPILRMDETPLQVFGEEGRANTTKSFMWVARGGLSGAEVVFYHYAPSRGAEVARRLVGDFAGFLQSDGYEVYDLVAKERPALTHVGCMAHVRRDFFDAKKSSKKAGSADEALAMIATLYAAEHHRASHADSQEFLSWRRATVAPVLDKFHTWLQRKSTQVPPKLLLGQAVAYALGQWPKLVRYLEHPDLTPDNNACEQAVRPFVLGRKNWLFSGSPRGADASATLYTLVETAKANGREPYFYLRKLFTELPLAKSEQDLHALLPFAVKD
jgi:transposase